MLGDRLRFDSVADFYEQIGYYMLNRGESISPRGKDTIELIAVSIVIMNPRARLAYNKDRKYNLIHALNESIMLFSESDKVRDICEFNKNMEQFSDDGITMYGSYGKRISSSIPHAIDRLKSDKHSRQAVLGIYDNKDLIANTKDVPCTENIQLLIRDNKLQMIVNMRSNDVLFGFQYDVFMFTMLQETIANTLGIDVGSYIHNAGSFHVYQTYPLFDGYEMLMDMSDCVSFAFENDCGIGMWRKLAKAKVSDTNQDDLSYLGGITETIYKLVLGERMYKTKKEMYNELLMNCYLSSPEWAKPFIEKYKKEV